MIKLEYDKHHNTIITTWKLKISTTLKKQTTKNGNTKIYSSYGTTFPQELYEFLEIQNKTIYIINEDINSKELILTTQKPTPPLKYKKIKLLIRKDGKNNRAPLTSFTLPKEIFTNIEEEKYIKLILYPDTTDQFRRKMGKIIIKTIK